MFRGRLKEAVSDAAAPTLERIRRDRLRASHRLARLLRHVEEHLFDPDLDATRAWRAAEIRDHSLSLEFRDLTGTSLKPYIEGARIEVAEQLLRCSDLEVGVIGLEVGYTYHATFIAAYKRQTGKAPSQARLAAPPPQPLDPLAGGFSRQEARDFLQRFHSVYPGLETPPAGHRTVVDGARYERLHAEDLWRRIRDLPPAEQRHEVRQYLFCSPVLFDLLRRKSRQEGRRDRQRGIELAELALVSLEDSEAVHGEKIHDLRALGWAWLGNAHRLALDFTAAEKAFTQADAEWHRPRIDVDLKFLGKICFLKGTLRMSERRYDEALEFVERARRSLRAAGDRKGEAEALVQAASIYTYSDRLSQAIKTLEAACGAVGGDSDGYLNFAILANLANLLVRRGQYRRASETLGLARNLYAELMDPLGGIHIQWIDANIQHGLGDADTAERLYLEAAAGFTECGQTIYGALAWLDLTILYSEFDRWDQALSSAAEIGPVLKSLELHPEAATAVVLLNKAVQAKALSHQVLRSVRRSLRRDPLAFLARQAARDLSPTLGT